MSSEDLFKSLIRSRIVDLKAIRQDIYFSTPASSNGSSRTPYIDGVLEVLEASQVKESPVTSDNSKTPYLRCKNCNKLIEYGHYNEDKSDPAHWYHIDTNSIPCNGFRGVATPLESETPGLAQTEAFTVPDEQPKIRCKTCGELVLHGTSQKDQRILWFHANSKQQLCYPHNPVAEPDF